MSDDELNIPQAYEQALAELARLQNKVLDEITTTVANKALWATMTPGTIDKLETISQHVQTTLQSVPGYKPKIHTRGFATNG
jgi:hypothetical protein